MSRKKQLGSLVAAIGMLGLIALCIPFVGSLGPNAKARSGWWQMDISHMSNGDFLYVDGAKSGHYSSRLLVLRAWDGSVHVYPIDTHNDEAMVTLIRGHNYYWLPCPDFGPELVAGKFKKGGAILCKDAENPFLGGTDSLRWDISGRNLDGSGEDMEVLQSRIVGNYLMVNWFGGQSS